jgi:integrase
LEGGEEEAIRNILNGAKPEGRQRPLELKYQAALELLFELALETAMRMNEMYTLLLDQLDLPNQTVYLSYTKNGDKRQVPLTTVAVRRVRAYLKHVKNGTRGMTGFKHEGGRLFPWWSGEVEENGAPTKRGKKQTTNLLSRQYDRVFAAAGCTDLNFHDTRHEATSRYYERTKLSDLQIAKITGHRDLRMLLRYANLRPSGLAKQLW